MADDEKTRWAIDVMTAWTHDDRHCQFMHERIDAYLAEPDGCVGLITGKDASATLQAIASTVSRNG